MKRKIYKIFGVALALVFAFSTTFAFSVPAMAAEEEWDLFEPPDEGADGDYFMDNTSVTLGPFVQAINGDLYIGWGSCPGAVPTATLSDTGSGEVALWSTDQKHSGSSSLELYHDGGSDMALVEFTPPTGITLAEFVAGITTYGFYYMRTVDGGRGPEMELRFTDGAIGSSGWARITIEAAGYDYINAPGTEDQWNQKTFSVTEQGQYFGEEFDNTGLAGGVNFDIEDVITLIVADSASAEDTVAAVGAWEMDLVSVSAGWGGPAVFNYVDDVRIDGITYDLEGADASSGTGTAVGAHLMISTDDGRTWEETDYAADTNGCTIVDMAVSSEDADVLYVATGTDVWKTDDAGDDWTGLGDPRVDSTTTETEAITCLAVGYSDDVPHVFVGTEDSGSGEVYYYEDAPFASIWYDLEVGGPDQSASAAADTSDVFGIGVSPDFDSDALVVAVIYDDTLDNSLVTANEGAAIGLSDWDDLEMLNDAAIPVSFQITGATNPVFVEDFDIDDDYELFVGVEGEAHDTSNDGGVYRITGTTGDDDFLLDDVDDDIVSLDLVGDLGGASLLAGTRNTATGTVLGSVWYSTDDGDTWDETDKEPSGLAVVSNLVIVAEDFADSGEGWCAANATTKEGGVHRTTDFGATWNGISLLDTNMAGAVYDIAHTADYGTDDAPLFLVTESGVAGDADDSVWKYDGTNWERVWFDDANELNMVEVSPVYAEDTALFIAASSGPAILYSHDGGADFSAMIRNPDESITAWVVIDDETIITGDAEGDYWTTTRYGRRVWDTGTICEDEAITDLAVSPNYAADGTVLAGNDDSEVFISFDEGEEWDEVSASDIEGLTTLDNDTYVAFDTRYADNSMIYAASDDIVARVEIDITEDMGDLEFDNFSGSSPDTPAVLTSGAAAGASGIVVSDDGTQAGEDVATLYVLDADATVIDAGDSGTAALLDGGVWRCLNPADTLGDVIFEQVLAGLTAGVDFTPVVGTIRNLELAGGSNTLYAIASSGIPADAAMPAVIYTYEDTLAAPVVLSSPADEARLVDTDRIEFEWEDLNADTVNVYEIEVNEEDDFPSATDEEIGNLDAAGVALAATDESDYTDDNELIWRLALGGTEYFWRVRVGQQTYDDTTDVWLGGPVLSRWSVVRSLMTKVEEVTAPVEVRPLPGAQEVILAPAFAWEAVTGADTYEIEVATDPEFEDLVTAGVTSINTWIIDVELDYATAYYWRVRGISSTGAPEGDWIVSVFTTMAKPAVAEPSVVVEVPPAQAAPQITVETIVPITPAYVWAIIAIGALLIIALIVLIVRTRRVV